MKGRVWRYARRAVQNAMIVVVFAGAFVAKLGEARIYSDLEPVDVWVTRIGPYSNPFESYDFYKKVPICSRREVEHKPLRLGEALRGERYSKVSALQIRFLQREDDALMCEMTLDPQTVADLSQMLIQQYTYEMVVDGLPSRLFLGIADLDAAMLPFGNSSSGSSSDPHAQGSPLLLYTHLQFSIAVNKEKRIVEVALKPKKPVPLHAATSENGEASDLLVAFTYSVEWIEKDVKYSMRHQKYYESFEVEDLELHWNSIIHASMTVLVVAAFFSFLILRIVRKDFMEHERMRKASGGVDVSAAELVADEAGGGAELEFGWKLVRGDVFRPPRYALLLSAMVGVGVQLLTLAGFMLTLGVFDVFHPLNNGTLVTCAVVSYSFTAGLAGYVSGSVYKQMEGRMWMRNAVLAAALFCGPVFVIFALLNSVSVLFLDSARVVPLWSALVVVILWAVVTFPLTIVGSIFGRNATKVSRPPCHVNSVARPIPQTEWYRRPPVMAAMSGIIPFISIYLELYYVLQTVWGYKVFSLYEVLALVFFMLLLVVSITTISSIYFQLVVEDYRWQWSSFFYGGAVSMYVFGYTFGFFVRSGSSTGSGLVLHLLHISAYSIILSSIFFLIFGSVGFFCVKLFVYFVFTSVKSD
eukprot:CAMPEP_0185847982 /NCGR_PEP_ID=MMETSP1354-20130828/3022_1 /TAXON_ID=708628 /ORGANISM="Erythrolobus madagascarensis, Strain CCMP3276" /LENGTH=639 /DNA_ID=CAMNT_0028548321 /DNA_START=229 /DNA_END=2148 /DNA_ORIENTATION=-